MAGLPNIIGAIDCTHIRIIQSTRAVVESTELKARWVCLDTAGGKLLYSPKKACQIILIIHDSTLPGTGNRKRSLTWYYFGCGVCIFTILVHMHLNTHRWHSSFTQVVYTHFPKLRAFVESDVACSYETFLRKK